MIDDLMPRRRRWTRSEYMAMADAGILDPNEHTELIDGEIIQMNHPQRTPHSIGVVLVDEALRAIFSGNCHIRTQLPMDIESTSEPEPDIAVVAGKPRDYLESHPATALLVVEVSDSTLAYDRKQKGSLYAKAGIADYWILNLPQRQLEVYRRPAPLRDEPFGYGYTSSDIYLPSDAVAPLVAPESTVIVTDLLP
jgi:Uma2 family endonuclease